MPSAFAKEFHRIPHILMSCTCIARNVHPFVLFLNWCARVTCWAPMGELKTAFGYLLFVVAVSTWARNKDWLFTTL